jgi:hypothetical protein
MSNKINPTLAEIRAFEERAPSGAVVMLNLMRFKEGVDSVSFMDELRQLNVPHFERAQAEIVYSGQAGPDFAGAETWEIAALVRYPSFAHFAELVTNADWLETAGALRERSLEDAMLVLTQPCT